MKVFFGFVTGFVILGLMTVTTFHYAFGAQGDAMPDGYQLPLAFCDGDEACVAEHAEMLRDLNRAYEKKGYQAQRNVAFCFTQGCGLAVQANAALGCAWRIVILASGSPKISGGDMDNLKLCLRGADSAEVAVIKSQAAALFETIYKRPIPADWR